MTDAADPALYQSEATAPVVYLDGHADIISPNDKVAVAGRWAVDR